MIGHQPDMADDSVDRLITNSVFLSERPGADDLRVLEYTQFTIREWVTRVNGVIDAAGATLGRGVTYTEITSPSALGSSLPSTDVLLVFPEYVGSGDLAAVGAAVHDDVLAFIDDGGVVVMLMNGRLDSGALHQNGAWRRGRGSSTPPAILLAPFPPPARSPRRRTRWA